MTLFWAFILDRTRLKHYNLRTRCLSRLSDTTHCIPVYPP